MSAFKILITDFSIFAQTLGKKLESSKTEVLYCLPRVDEITKYSDVIKSADLVEFNPIFDKNHATEEIGKNILNTWIEKL